PRESVALWERMAQVGGGGGSAEFLSTHPSHDTRIEQLKKWMPEALTLYQKRTPIPAAALPDVLGR
ncbi:MAG TPA: M48 family metalloprotease, partial [Nitrospira sp.]|nr:M48 family metalloprotease [Nitrospira sp.]